MESITVDQLKEKVLESNPVNIVDVRTDEKKLQWELFLEQNNSYGSNS